MARETRIATITGCHHVVVVGIVAARSHDEITNSTNVWHEYRCAVILIHVLATFSVVWV